MTEWEGFSQFTVRPWARWLNAGIVSCCQGAVKHPPMRIWRKPLLVSKLVKHRDGVNMLCSSTAAQPPTPNTPPPLPYPNTPPSTVLSQSWVNLQSSSGGSLALISVQRRSRGAQGTLRLPASNPAVLAGHSEITACHLEPMLKPSQPLSVQSHWPQLSVICAVFLFTSSFATRSFCLV